jgi:flagellar biosynthesis protein FlhF
MNVKTFQAPSMGEALARVKTELGTDAVILHTKAYRRGGVMGIGAKEVVEVTAGLDVKVAPRKKAAASGQSAVATALKERSDVSSGSERRNVVRSAYARTGGGSGGGTAVAEPPPGFASTREMAAATLKEPSFELRTEMTALRSMVESLLQRTASVAGNRTDLPEQLAKAYAGLIQQQVADEIAIRVVDDVKAELTPEQLGNAAMVREKLTAKIEALIPATQAGSVARPASGTGCRSICLIGPTGVGKTTTIAKLAASLKLRQKQRVGLITIDTYRIAAVDQLRTYANIIGVPLKVVLTPAEMQAAMRDFSDCDAVLIDTAGRSHSDQLKLNELSGFIQAGNPSEVHMVLSSTCTQEGMEAAIERFSTVRVDKIIFTKLDEAVSFGVLLNVARRASKALSYVTTGQDVPDHIEVGQPRRLARLILGDKL